MSEALAPFPASPQTLACAWSSRIPAANEEEAINHRWEQEDEVGNGLAA